MATALIADKVKVARRYVRAVDVARDLEDPRALDGYVVTPSVRDGLSHILAGLAAGSTQRAFRVTGPYGSGKSSFGLLLARLFREREDDGPARRIVGEALGAVSVPDHLPILLVGRRTSFADALLEAVRSAAMDGAGRDEESAGRCSELLKARGAGSRDVRPVLDLVSAYGRALSDRSGRKLVLLIDEMGRYLEYAAASPSLEDPSIFQLLAERAGGASPDFAVIGFLHHRFGDYVAGLGDWMEGEWARSSERYEEIAFQESTEQTLHLVAQALAPEAPHSRPVVERSVELYRSAGERKLFASSGADLAEVAERLYPIHPAALACLASSSRRFGQNERSVFSFLQSLEPSGFQRFAHEHHYGPGCWYRLDQLFDYFAAQGTFRFRSGDRERRWQLALDAIALCADAGAAELSVLKALSVLAVLEPVPGLKSDPLTIAWCLDLEPKAVAAALAALAERGVAHLRTTRGDYSLWSHASVDLDRWMEDAKNAVPQNRRLDDVLCALPPAQPLIAHRHYHRTGTLRTFGSAIGELAPARLIEDDDGALLVLPLYPGDPEEEGVERAKRLSIEAGRLSLVRTRRITAADLSQTHELACWQWVRSNCRELRIDEIARAEVDRRIAALESELLKLFAPFSDPLRGAANEIWYYQGRPVELRSRAALSRLLSDICDDVFGDAPVLRNELINRDKLSTAIAAARMRLLEKMLTDEGSEYLGLTGAPPERTIYLSVFHASGLHSGEAGAFHFHPPQPDDLKNWYPTWLRIDELVRAGPVKFDQLIAELARPPIGLRAGPALLIIAAYMLYNRTSIALMERNSFQPEVTPAHFMRLAKTPSNFALRHVAVTEASEVLIALTGGLTIWERKPPEAELKPLVEALYRWWEELPDYTKQTRSIDAMAQAVRLVLRKAREPVELIFESLPSACAAVSDGKVDVPVFAASLDIALGQIADAYPTLQQRAAAALTEAFGARSIEQLRHQIELDYHDHLLDLGDRSLRAFVDRAINPGLTDWAWLDGVASLIVGRRLESWDDDTIDGFSFEVRSMAQRLARRLAQIRESKAMKSPITVVHILGADGTERSLYLRVSDHAGSEGEAGKDLRTILARADDPDRLLLDLLAERMAATEREEAK